MGSVIGLMRLGNGRGWLIEKTHHDRVDQLFLLQIPSSLIPCSKLFFFFLVYISSSTADDFHAVTIVVQSSSVITVIIVCNLWPTYFHRDGENQSCSVGLKSSLITRTQSTIEICRSE